MVQNYKYWQGSISKLWSQGGKKDKRQSINYVPIYVEIRCVCMYMYRGAFPTYNSILFEHVAIMIYSGITWLNMFSLIIDVFAEYCSISLRPK